MYPLCTSEGYPQTPLEFEEVARRGGLSGLLSSAEVARGVLLSAVPTRAGIGDAPGALGVSGVSGQCLCDRRGPPPSEPATPHALVPGDMGDHPPGGWRKCFGPPTRLGTRQL